MPNSRVLVVEDEPKVADFVTRGLREEQFQVDHAADGMIGKSLALANNYDLIILDLQLPRLNGLELCKILREQNTGVPVLMLTALGTMDDKLAGFEAGADDYLPKPFEFRELLARTKVLIKRNQLSTEENQLSVGELVMDLRMKTVSRGGRNIQLTAREFALLELLLRNPGRVLSRAEIAEKVWDIRFDTGTNVIDVYINFLRKKVDKDFDTKLIHTIIGMGYVIKVEEVA
ncbi:MAG: response regulator [Bacteroidota bacterium]|jgi:two-component system copper resistance phosphate regulon response regulator CusR